MFPELVTWLEERVVVSRLYTASVRKYDIDLLRVVLRRRSCTVAGWNHVDSGAVSRCERYTQCSPLSIKTTSRRNRYRDRRELGRSL